MDQIRIVFLGTGAAAPTRDRNVSSMAVVLDRRVLLFDCGEGTQHQLMKSPARSGAIEAIFITHLHGDHLYGLPGLISTSGLNARTAPLTIYGPTGLRKFLESIPHLGATYPIEVVEIGPNEIGPSDPDRSAAPVTPLPAGEGGAPHRGAPGEGRVSRQDRDEIRGAPGEGRAKEICRASGYSVMATLLDHSVPCLGYAVIEDDRPGTFGVRRARMLGVPEGPLFGKLQRGQDVEVNGRTIRSAEVVGPRRQGRRIVLCTDTRPCQAAIDLARGADVLIHEATYASDHAQDAVDRFHSTAAEAARVAAAAQPRQLILTHVSARYETGEPLVAEARAIFANVQVAHDLLVLPVRPLE